MRPAPALTFLSVCSGIEAASVAWTPLGWRPLGFAEIETFPSAVLKHHYPNVPNHGDFTKINTRRIPRVDVLCGGTPCQAFSVAGARNSLSDARGNLTLAFVGLAHALKPRNVVWENVPGVLSTKDNAFGCFLAGLVGANAPFVPTAPSPAAGKSNRAWGWSAKSRAHYIKWPRAGLVTGPLGTAAWRVLDAQYFGLAQRRERVIVVADFGNGADPAAVLFEPEGVRRDSPPSREAGQRVTGTIASRTTGGGGLGTDFDLDGGWDQSAVSRPLLAKGNDSFDETLQTYVLHAPTLARCVATREGSSQDYELTTMLAVTSVTGPISHTLKGEGADASEDETGRGTPIVVHSVCLGSDPIFARDVAMPLTTRHGDPGVICFSAKDYGADATLDLSPTLRAGGHAGSHANAGVMPAIAFQGRGSNLDLGQDITGTLSQNCDRASGGAPCVALALRGREGGATAELGDDCAFALRASGGGGGDKPHVLTSAVRRLTPRECERLQGFQWRCSPTYPGAWQDHAGRWWSPDYTNIPWRGRATSPDGPRYKSLGNSWAVPKFAWLGRRIAALMPRRALVIDLAAVRAELALLPTLAALQARLAA